MIKKISDDYETKDEKLMPYKRMVDNFRLYFDNIYFEQVPRIQNKATDTMTTIGSLLDIPNNASQYEFLVEQLLIPAFDVPKTKLMHELVGLESPWYNDIYAYLHDQIIPLDLYPNQWNTFIQQASKYAIIRNTLYHHSLDSTLL